MTETTMRTERMTHDELWELRGMENHPDVIAARARVAEASARVSETEANVQQARTQAATASDGLDRRAAKRHATEMVDLYDRAERDRRAAAADLRAAESRVHDLAVPLVREEFSFVLAEL